MKRTGRMIATKFVLEATKFTLETTKNGSIENYSCFCMYIHNETQISVELSPIPA